MSDVMRQAAEVIHGHACPSDPDVGCCWDEEGRECDLTQFTGFAQALADAGLLATRERYASLDQLKPGDRIVWTSGGKTEVRELSDVWWPRIHSGDEAVLRWTNGSGSRVNASLLVRRADTPPQQEAANHGLCDCPPDTRGNACNGTCKEIR